MAKKDNKKLSAVNKVQRKSEELELNLGSKAKQLEDEIKKPRRKATAIQTGGKKKVSKTEDSYISKGRAPTRTSDIEKEYTKELQKLKNKLRYREKQGFYVKWETLPSRPTRITSDDLEKLKMFGIKLNEANEIEVYRTAYSKQGNEMPAKLRIKYQDTPNYDIRNDPNFVPPAESLQNFDVFARIEHTLLEDMTKVSTDGVQSDHPLNENHWIRMSQLVEDAYQEAYDIFVATRDSHRRQEYADYLYQHEHEVTEAIDVMLFLSEEDQVDDAKTEMLKYLEMH